MRPVIIIDDENFAPPTKERQITIYKQELFEDMDAESYKFSEIRPDLPSHRSDILASEYPIQEKPYSLSKERVVTVNKQLLFEDLDAETIKFAQTHPDIAPSDSISSKNSSLFNVVQSKEKQITIYKQQLFEDMDAETVKFSQMHPELAPLESTASVSGTLVQTTPYVLTKERVITIYKQKLYDDIDAETYKFSEFKDGTPQQQNAAASNSAERLDGHVIARLVEKSDAKLRQRLVRYLKNTAVVTSANDEMTLDASLVYDLFLSTEFNDSMVVALKDHIHHYLVWDVLLDWYGAGLGSAQAEWYKKSIEETEMKIISMINRIDGKLAVQHLEFADAKLRKRIVRYLDDSASVEDADNNLDLSGTFVYNLVLPSEFNDSQVDALKDHINRYLIWCALYDWYGASLGVDHARWFEKQIADIEASIVMMTARIDGRLAERHLEYGDAKLRKRLLRFLNNTPIIPSVGNEVDMESSFVYALILSTEFNDSQMSALASHINRYLVWSALYDWYGASLGSTQSRWFESQIKTIGDNIVTMVARIDGHLAVRHLEFRDAKLRKKLVRFIKNEDEVITANDTIDLSSTFVYDFELPVIFKDSMLDPLKDYIHRYLVWGGLFDWYGASLGSDQAEWFRGELKDLEDAIVGMLSLPSIVKRPIQPFGPAKKMY